MGIISTEVEVKLWGSNIKHYNNLGYKGKNGDIITVKVEDLTKGSSIKILAKCDFCGEEKWVRYKDYLKCAENNIYSCINCRFLKKPREKKQVVKPNILNSELSHDERKEIANKKRIETCLKKYGVPYALQSKVVRDKRNKTMMEKYNTIIPCQLEEFKQKKNETMMNRYGCINILQNNEIKEKYFSTLMRNYGVRNPSQSPEIREKMTKKLYENGKQKCSSQQLYLFNLYNMTDVTELNYPILQFNADICFIKEKLICEYDGSGHDLSVRLGKYTQEEFNHKELIRDRVIKSEGYKIIRIQSKTDKLPSDLILLNMLSYARNYFSQYPQHSWITFNLDSSFIRSAEYKDGIFFNYGELRTIKEVA